MPTELREEATSEPQILLLPALSSISTREEMAPLARQLGHAFDARPVDWPGFGTGPRTLVNWTPDILSEFLRDTVDRAKPKAIVAAGHAAAYAVYAAASGAIAADCLVLVAPTWRGPLPTMMGGRRPWFARIVSALDSKVFGRLLYRLNVSDWVIRKMAREHVYSDPSWLAGSRLQSKIAVTRGRGARHSSVRFVTGTLDRYASRDAFLRDLAKVKCPVLIVYGEETPRRSRAEMEAMSQLPGVTPRILPRGKLAVHEEFADDVALEVRRFLDANV